MNPGVSAFRLKGSSMLPVFKAGETALVSLIVQEPYPKGLNRGDCAVYSYEGRNLLHRVLEVSGAGAWFGDDAGRLEPHFVPWENIRGKALSRNPLAGGFCGHLYSRFRRSLAKLHS